MNRTFRARDQALTSRQFRARRPLRFPPLAFALLSYAVPSISHAFAFTFDNPDLSGDFNTTLSYTAAYRIRPANSNLLFGPNDPAAINLDDGDNAFRHRGLIENRVDMFSEFDLKYKRFGVRLSGEALDRYDWKIVGKKEMIVPYNVNRALQFKPDQLLGNHFIDPDAVRWEVHRVWVVDAQLKADKRHQIPHKRFYLDEDTWAAVLEDGWDANDQLVKAYWQWLVAMPDVPGAIAYQFGSYDLLRGGYLAQAVVSTGGTQYEVHAEGFSNDMFTADAMAAAGQ